MFTIHFVRGNDETIISGDANSEITLRKQKDHIVIVREKGKKENQETKDNPVPKVAIPDQQFKLTDALYNRPWINYKAQNTLFSKGAHFEGNNGHYRVYTDVNPRDSGWYMSLDFSWSPGKSAYIGTWSDYYNNVRGRITLWPHYDSHGNIKCFSGYMGNESGSHDTIIKVKNMICLCPDPG